MRIVRIMMTRGDDDKDDNDEWVDNPKDKANKANDPQPQLDNSPIYRLRVQGELTFCPLHRLHKKARAVPYPDFHFNHVHNKLYARARARVHTHTRTIPTTPSP